MCGAGHDHYCSPRLSCCWSTTQCGAASCCCMSPGCSLLSEIASPMTKRNDPRNYLSTKLRCAPLLIKIKMQYRSIQCCSGEFCLIFYIKLLVFLVIYMPIHSGGNLPQKLGGNISPSGSTSPYSPGASLMLYKSKLSWNKEGHTLNNK